jgi:isoleucyl-tRNA synthetase
LNFDLIKQDLQANTDKLNHFDKWIISKVNDTIEESENMYDKFML